MIQIVQMLTEARLKEGQHLSINQEDHKEQKLADNQHNQRKKRQVLGIVKELEQHPMEVQLL